MTYYLLHSEPIGVVYLNSAPTKPHGVITARFEVRWNRKIKAHVARMSARYKGKLYGPQLSRVLGDAKDMAPLCSCRDDWIANFQAPILDDPEHDWAPTFPDLGEPYTVKPLHTTELKPLLLRAGLNRAVAAKCKETSPCPTT